jgi:delta 1-pyrroline-5-carboxylate dehydrogenase
MIAEILALIEILGNLADLLTKNNTDASIIALIEEAAKSLSNVIEEVSNANKTGSDLTASQLASIIASRNKAEANLKSLL